MAIREIIEVPDPRLKIISKPVERFDDELRALVADMFETMYDAPGIGLAAIQMAVPLRVLVIDLDSQGSMTSIMGGKVADEWQTVFPLLARDYAMHVQAENAVRVAAGQGELPLDETLTEALQVSPRNIVQKTHWPNIDLSGAQLNLYWAEFQVPVWRMQLRNWPLWDSLGGAPGPVPAPHTVGAFGVGEASRRGTGCRVGSLRSEISAASEHR